MVAKAKTIEEIYQKKTPHEHVLERPGMYIGSIKNVTEAQWVVKENKIVSEIIEYNPGLLKIFDEILVNAIDHSVREGTGVKNIKVNFDRKAGSITVYNDGKGIDIVVHKEHKIYIPELIFGNLLTSTNYDDTSERVVGGTNGLGGKCLWRDTKIPLFNGDFKLAKDIEIGDELIGDDGTKRTVLGKITGEGDMYDIKQPFGEMYTVNDNHTLTLHMPDHKVIFWNFDGWSIVYWDGKKIKSKKFSVFSGKDSCEICKKIFKNNLLFNHYEKHHPDFTFKSKIRVMFFIVIK